MAFSVNEFARENRVILIWTVFFALLYILREMFGLIFITFVMSFIAHGLSRLIYRITKQRRKFLVLVIYLVFFFLVVFFFRYAFPQILTEGRQFVEELPKIVQKVNLSLDEYSESHPFLQSGVDRIKESLTAESLTNLALKFGRTTLSHVWKYLSWFFIGMLFSFLIILDLPDLIQKCRRLRFTKLQVIYDETAANIIKFGQVVGENFRAQILISTINTFLTFIGLSIIGTGSTALLSIVVFCCGLVPVLGVLISSIPITLVAVNVGGLTMGLEVLGLIVFIHAVEAYILNPRIISAVMKINPVLTLMILYLAHALMGVWGMLLGVPISVFFFQQIRNKEGKNGHGPLNSSPNGSLSGSLNGSINGSAGHNSTPSSPGATGQSSNDAKAKTQNSQTQEGQTNEKFMDDLGL
jgi:predicted PurR-regulated permease PerM